MEPASSSLPTHIRTWPGPPVKLHPDAVKIIQVEGMAMSDPFNASKNYLDNYREDDGYFENNGNGKKDDGSAFHEGEAMVKGTMDMVDANGFE